ncbi:hypothetical protein ACFWU3_13810 [Streptomyces sp. NPDC058685]|uniref:hypothetical protein n=1 Tax=Streptomyces sp. NPDC058685 TaxID=3346598 RepID=UPI003648C3AD
MSATNVVKSTSEILVASLKAGTPPAQQKAATNFANQVNNTLKTAQNPKSSSEQRSAATKKLTQWDDSLPKCLQQNPFQECVASATTGR